ncbi:MAG: hypothetical protein QM503_04715 [Bacteroidota bacterium]
MFVLYNTMVVYLSNYYDKNTLLTMESQKIPIKIHGTLGTIADKLDCSRDYVGRVLSGKVKQKGKKAKEIIELATEYSSILS